MRLVDRDGLPDDTRYAILSHKWLEGRHREITFDDIRLLRQTQPPPPDKTRSLRKIRRFCRMAKKDGHAYVWLDTCCIDGKSLVETSTAINSMFKWYKEAAVCYVHLGEYDALTTSDPTGDVWFTRGWTLQEFVASKSIKFFDKNWICACTCDVAVAKPRRQDRAILELIYHKTGINKDRIVSDKQLESISLAQRMSWYKGRTTKKPEDTPYCLMGIFAVNMPTFYGEGKSAHSSLFAWKLPPSLLPKSADERLGLLAPEPTCFEDSGGYYHKPSSLNNRPFAMTNKGLEIDLYLTEASDGCHLASLDCPHPVEERSLSVYLKLVDPVKNQYARVRAETLLSVEVPGVLKTVFVTQPL